ncbi:MAG TPA: type II secretion system F family protein [Acidimicrobiales bacterium]|nr:type II secretion system F family protein [Acidimicrobiales bacterium]
MLLLIVAIAGLFTCLVLGVLGVSQYLDERAAVRASLRNLEGYDVQSVRATELQQDIGSRLGVPVARSLTAVGKRFTPTGYADQVMAKLTKAGRGRADDLDRFLAMRVVTIVLIPVVLLVSFLLPVSTRFQWCIAIFSVLLLVLGPDAVLNRKVAERQFEIQAQLPDVLDLLTISVEAGLGFEQALDKTVGALPGALAEEFGRMLGEVRAGSSRADALRAFEQRTGVSDVKSFVLAILQADTFGVSVGRVLRLQADEMRVRRRQLAQERAQKAPVKMLFPMVFCIFPALFVILLAPAALSYLEKT